MKNFKFKTTILCTSITLILSGCGSDSDDKTEKQVSIDSPPVIELSSEATVKEQESIVLTATVSDDNSGLTYAWTQDSGPAVTVIGETTASINVSAPSLDSNAEAVFTLTVTDSAGQSESKSITLEMLNNVAPVISANFGSAQEKSIATLAVTASDDDGVIESYNWEQTAGPEVSLDNSSNEQVSFDVPSVSEDTELMFKVTVTDNNGDSTEIEETFLISSIDNSYVLSGSVASEKFVNSTVNALFQGQAYQQTTDSNGDFSFTFTADDDETNLFSRINAISAMNSSLEYSAFVPTLGLSTQEETPSINKMDTVSNTDQANNVSLSAVSTALVALITAANGDNPPEDLDSFTLVEKGVDPDVLIEAAAVVKYASENDIQLPEGTENLIDLVQDPDAYNEFITVVEQTDPGAIANEVAKIIADPELTPPVDETSLPSYYVRTYPTAAGFLSRGGQQYTFEEDGTGKYVHSNGALDYNWSLDDGVITLTYTGGQGFISYLSVEVGNAGLTQQQVDQLIDSGIFQVEVTYTPETTTLKRIVEGQAIDSYRLNVIESAKMTPVELGDNVIETEKYTTSGEFDVPMRKVAENSDLAFSEVDIAGTWAIQHYNNESLNFILDPYVLAQDKTGTLQDSTEVIEWDLVEGVLKVTFADNSYQTSTIIDQLNGDLQLLNIAYSAAGEIEATEVMYGFKVDTDAAALVDVKNEPSTFWQGMVNQWTKDNWTDGKLEFYYAGEVNNGLNLFGFQLTESDSRRINYLEGTQEDYTLQGVNVGWMQEMRDVTINYFGNFSCSDDLSKPCRTREWEILKSQPGVAGERLYVKERDYYLLDENGWYNSQGEQWEIIAPRINIYENIPENYWMNEMVNGITPSTNLSNTGTKLGYKVLSPNDKHSSKY
ncbi:hypothetical protein [Pseudoalteromonas sp. HF66]|uniref:PKD domain-containing protein n=1 Tax=Pseudoalteromonas sp. HF66 TaxID=2721559 RepID=UPI00142F677A|nr:hypothetical protein [Pseudoalteromonas sp. HF66]NIZ03991.1 hypothetical protein [Pseudoalteromonas sp. HF66]